MRPVVTRPKQDLTMKGTEHKNDRIAAARTGLLIALVWLNALGVLRAWGAGCVKPPNGIIAWWPGDGHVLDFAGTNDGCLANGACFASGVLGRAFNLDGVDDFVEVGELPQLQNAEAITVLAWVKRRDYVNAQPGIVGRWDGWPASPLNSFLLYSGEGPAVNKGAWALAFTDGTSALLAGNSPIPTTTWVLIAATWNSSNGYAALYKNGVLDKSMTLGVGKRLSYTPGCTIKIGEWGIVRDAQSKFCGQIDEVAIFNCALSPSEIQAIYAARSSGLCRTPTLVAQPQGQTNYWGQRVVLIVKAVGERPMTYQWLMNGSPLLGETNASLTIDPAGAAHSGFYSVIVANPRGNVTSDTANLTLVPPQPPTFIAQPQSQSLVAGDTLVFSAACSGTGPLFYQWRLNGNNLPGATNETLTLTNVQAVNGGSYSLVVWSSLGIVESEVALVRLQLPVLPFSDAFAAAGSLTATSGTGASSNTGATAEAGEARHAGKQGGKSIWIKWRAPADGIVSIDTFGSSFDTLLAVYTGNNVSNLTEVAISDDKGGFLTSKLRFNARSNTTYRIAVDGFGGASGEVVLNWDLEVTTDRLPEILVHPLCQTVSEGGDVTFAVTTSDANATFQWFFNGNLMPGEVAPQITLANVGFAQVGQYFVQVTVGSRSLRSRAASLQLNATDAGFQDVRTADKLLDAVATVKEGVPVFVELSRIRKLSSSGAGSIARGYTGTQIFSTYGAGKELGEPNHCGVAGGASCWFLYQAPRTGTMLIDTEGSTFDTVLAVYTGPGTDFASLVPVACDNDSGSNGKWSKVMFMATAGMTYYFAVDGVLGATGTVKLHYVLGDPPAIVTQPASQAVPVGGTAILAVAAIAAPAPTYQWTFNGLVITGATNVTIAVTNFQSAQAGSYQVKVSNPLGVVKSDHADLVPAGPLRLVSCVTTGTEGPTLRIEGAPYQAYVVECSTNLTQWTPLATNLAATSLWEYLDRSATNVSRRFYRAVVR